MVQSTITFLSGLFAIAFYTHTRGNLLEQIYPQIINFADKLILTKWNFLDIIIVSLSAIIKKFSQIKKGYLNGYSNS